MFSHLFLPTDLSPASVEFLGNLELFRKLGGEEITLYHVYEVGHPMPATPRRDDYFGPKLRAAALELESQGWKVNTIMEEGRTASMIVKGAQKVGADLIVISNRGRGAVEEVLVGSVAMEVLEHSPLPIFLYAVGSEVVPGKEQVLIHATDFSVAAQGAFQWAVASAREGGQRLLLVHMTPGAGEREDHHLSEKEATRVLNELREAAVQAGVNRVESQIIKGQPKKEMKSLLKTNPDAVVAMGNHGRGWLGDWMLGGIARRVARTGTHHVFFSSSRAEES